MRSKYNTFIKWATGKGTPCYESESVSVAESEYVSVAESEYVLLLKVSM